jgi:hypothetical protein
MKVNCENVGCESTIRTCFAVILFLCVVGTNLKSLNRFISKNYNSIIFIVVMKLFSVQSSRAVMIICSRDDFVRYRVLGLSLTIVLNWVVVTYAYVVSLLGGEQQLYEGYG